ncbi:hypothetical protein LJR039_007565 [Pseudorhodoferax sp. LjRoot39]|uniref:type IV secretory system conjugative DNA transfer family protein n=1 Tax=Pseudorhodoferax sp. LjRoot39 TaxID=3342328 RepID=UPI003ECDCE91
MSFLSNFDAPLLRLSSHDNFTLRDACNGVHIFGGIGSGKTSGTGKALSGAYLRAGMGGLVMCAKPEEVELWMHYAREHGRTNSVIVFDENEGFNFITYELARHGVEGSSNVTECLMRVLEASDIAAGSGEGASSERFWEDATRQILNYTIPLIYVAWGQVTISSIIDFVMSAATTPELWNNQDWLERSFAANTFRRATNAPAVHVQDGDLRKLVNYWHQQFMRIPEKTRGNILISLTTRLDRFNHGKLAKAFCGDTTIVPEMTFHGAIIIMAMPVLTWNADGLVGQQLFKFMWQRAVEARNGLGEVHRQRPVFLWADEAQYFVSVKDDEFLSTCRGSRACVVFLSQTLPTYYAKMGRSKEQAVNGLVGKFNTQVFHLNACNTTNKFAADLIGRGIQMRYNSSRNVGSNSSRGMNTGENESRGTSSNSGSSSGAGGGSSNSGSGSNYSAGNSWGNNTSSGRSEGESWGANEQMDYLVEPRVFAAELKSGGPAHGEKVTAIWFRAGAKFHASNGSNFLNPTFQQ